MGYYIYFMKIAFFHSTIYTVHLSMQMEKKEDVLQMGVRRHFMPVTREIPQNHTKSSD